MKHYEKLKQLLYEELGHTEYSFRAFTTTSSQSYSEKYYIDVYKNGDFVKRLSFNLTDEIITIALGGVAYYKIKSNDYLIKYFWIALLS